MPELIHLPSDCTVDDMLEVSDRDGGVIVDGWLTPDLLDRFNRQLDPLLRAHSGTDSGSEASDEFLGLRTKRLQGLAVKAPAFVEIMTDERLLDYALAIVGPISPTVILNNGEVIDIGPGESAQPWHRDDDAWIHANAPAPLMINTIAALVDITADMGGTLVAPGSHRWEDPERVPTDAETVACELSAGSTLFFRGDTLHAGGANTTSDRRRRALSTGICAGWLRPVENSYTNVPIETAAMLPERAREILGYAFYDASSIGGGYLGYHDMGDPKKLFD